MDLIPDEILSYILQYVTVKHCKNVLLVNMRFNNIYSYLLKNSDVIIKSTIATIHKHKKIENTLTQLRIINIQAFITKSMSDIGTDIKFITSDLKNVIRFKYTDTITRIRMRVSVYIDIGACGSSYKKNGSYICMFGSDYRKGVHEILAMIAKYAREIYIIQ